MIIALRRFSVVLLALTTAFALLPLSADAHHREGHQQPPGQGKKTAPDGGEAAGPPTDYIALADTLSQPVYGDEDLVRETFEVPLHDGERMYVEVVMPDPALLEDGEGWPVIMEASPYHGTLADREGIRIFPDPRDENGDPIGMTGYFAPRGYAVVMADLRGTGRSSGCLDHLGQNDAKDLKTIIEWAAGADWSSGKVGLTGHSYVGSTPSVAAAQNPRGLVTIAPSAGLASMYDHQFQSGVPYYLQWMGPMYAYPTLSTTRDLPPGIDTPLGPTGDNWLSDDLDQTGCGWTSSAVLAGEGQVTGQYQAWHAERDWREGAAASDIPIFMIHGVNDNAARIPAAEWFFGDRFGKEDDKVWLGQWDHGSAGATSCRDADSYGHVNCRFDQWTYALHAWFDHHLMGRDVDTGNPVEVFLNGDLVHTATSWDAPEATLGLHPDAADMTLDTSAPESAGSASFTAYSTSLTTSGSSIEFTSEPLAEDVVLAGLPAHRLHASVTTSQALNLISVLEREDADGERHAVSYCAIQPQLRHGLSTPKPIVPGEKMEMTSQCFTAAHHVAAGERLVLSVRTSSPHHVSTFSEDAEVTVFTGPGETAISVPVAEDAQLYPDVNRFEPDDGDEERPVGPAQDPVEGTVTVPAPGAGVQVVPLTSAEFTFEVEDGYDNEELDVLAVPDVPADIDLYLQRRNEDGTWSSSLASGTSPSMEDETLWYQRPAPGTYRLLVHNWAGPPASVHLTITFTNQAGQVGSGEQAVVSGSDDAGDQGDGGLLGLLP